VTLAPPPAMPRGKIVAPKIFAPKIFASMASV
jgi:hypothetical protein